MTPHLMTSIEDLDCFSSEQIELTRKLDEEKGGVQQFIWSATGALTEIHQAMVMVSLPHFQRAAYEAHWDWKRTGKKSSLIASKVMWRVVLYMQGIWEGMVEDLKDPEVRAVAEKIGKKIGLDLLGEFERMQEE